MGSLGEQASGGMRRDGAGAPAEPAAHAPSAAAQSIAHGTCQGNSIPVLPGLPILLSDPGCWNS